MIALKKLLTSINSTLVQVQLIAVILGVCLGGRLRDGNEGKLGAVPGSLSAF